MERRFDLSLTQLGRERALPPAESVGGVLRAIESLRGERDATLDVALAGDDEHLLVFVDGSQAFVGLDSPDGMFQFARDHAPATKVELTIGGQRTDLEAEYVIDLEQAMLVVEAWLDELTPRDVPSIGRWRRQ